MQKDPAPSPNCLMLPMNLVYILPLLYNLSSFATPMCIQGKYNQTAVYPACNDDMPAQTFQFIPSCKC